MKKSIVLAIFLGFLTLAPASVHAFDFFDIFNHKRVAVLENEINKRIAALEDEVHQKNLQLYETGQSATKWKFTVAIVALIFLYFGVGIGSKARKDSKKRE